MKEWINNYWWYLTSCNWLAVMWFVYILATTLLALPKFYFDSFIPTWLHHLPAYGKLRKNDIKTKPKTDVERLSWLSSPIKLLLTAQVPKSYFKHFYIMGTVYSVSLMLLLFFSYSTLTTPTHFIWFLDVVAGDNRNAYDMDATTTIVAMTLVLCQVSRRAYECCCISVFSPNAKMHWSYYLVGLTFYFNVITSIMVEAPGFTHAGFDHISFKRENSWNWYQLLGIGCYFWAAWHQHCCMRIFASLRTSKQGEVTTSEYRIPSGDWFNYVSSPHYLAEILIYISLNILLKFNNALVILALIFTVINQVVMATENHRYYLANFKDYPKTRKIIIPAFY